MLYRLQPESLRPQSEDRGFEVLIADLCSRLETQSWSELSETVVWGLKVIADHIGAERISLIEFEPEESGGAVVCSHCASHAKEN